MTFLSKLRKAGAIVIIEGNISAGKSTLCKEMGELLSHSYDAVLEPLVENPFLELFYKEPTKYALRMQMFLLRSRFITYILALRRLQTQGRGVLLDRSVFSDSVFAVKNRVDGNISPAGFEYYLHQRDKMLRSLPRPDLAIYLDVSPQICHDRVHSMRKRTCESGIPLAYLSGLHECYDEFFTDMSKLGSKTVRVNWESFGNPCDVAKVIIDSAASLDSLACEGADYSWINDDNAVIEALRPDYIFEEADDYEDYTSEEFADKVFEQLKRTEGEFELNAKEKSEVERVTAQRKTEIDV